MLRRRWQPAALAFEARGIHATGCGTLEFSEVSLSGSSFTPQMPRRQPLRTSSALPHCVSVRRGYERGLWRGVLNQAQFQPLPDKVCARAVLQQHVPLSSRTYITYSSTVLLVV